MTAPSAPIQDHSDTSASPLLGHRGMLLHFDANDHACWYEDGLLVVQGEHILAVGDFAQLSPSYPSISVTQHHGKILAPGFVDLHVHYPQIDIIASPAAGLLPWLQSYTFPEEARFCDDAHAAEVAQFFISQLLCNGVTSAMCFATSHPNSVNALFEAAQTKHMSLVTGLCLMDQNAPDALLSASDAIAQSEALIAKWHSPNLPNHKTNPQSSRLGYAITPRFVPSCSQNLLQAAGRLAQHHPSVWIQSHVAENLDEIAWVKSLYPQARSYASVYEQFGLLRKRAVYAHGIHLDDQDRQLFTQTQASIAVSPTSNLFLGSGFFDFDKATAAGMPHGLASDVGGGTSLSPFVTMRAAYFVGREGFGKTSVGLSAAQLWWLHTLGAAKSLDVAHVQGNLAAGLYADFVVLDPQATPLLTRRWSRACSLEERLFALVMLGDDRVVEKTYVAGTAVA